MIVKELKPLSLEEVKLTKKSKLVDTLRDACKKLAPVWPLENFVAVNPYLGLTNLKFNDAAQTLSLTGGVKMTLPISFYLEKLEQGNLALEDLQSIQLKHSNYFEPDVVDFIKKAKELEDINETSTVPTVANIATVVTRKDWNRFMIARISSWAAAYFDKGQAAWISTNQKESIFNSWKTDASTDLTTELYGLSGFRKNAKSMSNHALEAAFEALEIMEIPEEGLPIYLHRLLLQVGGWSAHVARLDWENELYGGKDGRLIEFLCILICWDACLLKCTYTPELYKEWKSTVKKLENPSGSFHFNKSLTYKLAFQEAFELSTQKSLVQKFENKQDSIRPTPPLAQAVFCIDVRSEVFRRNLEHVDAGFETLGFAGFFAFPIKYVPLAYKVGESQCPVLLKTGPSIMEVLPNPMEQKQAEHNRALKQQAKYIWKTFKAGAVTCFGFVSPTGISYLPKLFTDSFGWTRPVSQPNEDGLSVTMSKKKTISLAVEHLHSESVGIPLAQQIQMAKNALNAMSLTNNFAEWVLIVGHGSTSVNNPHATGLDCGACGGHTGEANAKVATAVLNNPQVRESLKAENIFIPENTVFLACLHDTTTDEVTIYNEEGIPQNKKQSLEHLKKSLIKAGHASRSERAFRMSIKASGSIDKFIKTRSNDWSQVRPEWGLAGCEAFVVAPRERTKGIDLGGKSFLHTYNWKEDQGFSVLELIMTAPMVVTSWINLQYYASTVDNNIFGAGNKTLHNVTSGLGVLEGYSGDLRVGLPIQSVHDGEKYQHEPIKLNVIIEAPIEAMNAILEKHSSIKNLCDNGWIHLMAMNEEGKVSYQYTGESKWQKITLK